MKIVVTETATLLGTRLMDALRSRPDTVVVGFEGDATDSVACEQALAGASVLIDLRPHAALDTAPKAGDVDDPSTWRAAGHFLETMSRGTYVLMRAAVGAGVSRVILGSSLRHFEEYDPEWSVGETWRPRPDIDDPGGLGVYLCEETARQLALVEPIAVVCLRLARVRTDGIGPDDVHADDAAQACLRAVDAPLAIGETYARAGLNTGWWVFHIPGAGRSARFPVAGAEAIGYQPSHPCAELPRDARHVEHPPIATRSIRRVTVFGAGGPLGSATTPHLTSAYIVRLTDARDLDEIRVANQPQSLGAPLPTVPPLPHTAVVCDVTDPEAVAAQCADADALVNLTVIRHDVVGAFRINLEGAYYVMCAARRSHIRRVIHTGPALNLHDRPAGYGHEFGVPDDAPARTGVWQYTVSKYLGQEVVRLFAEALGMEVPTLVFCAFVNPETAEPVPGGPHPMSISWDDAGRAIRGALDAPAYPAPWEVVHITADLPHDRYRNSRARELLHWAPRDTLASLYRR